MTAFGAAASVAGGCADSTPAPAPRPGITTELLNVGLYSWDEITYLPKQINWLGLRYARIGGVMSDPVMKFCADHDIEVLLNVTPAAPRTSFKTDAAFIAAYLAQIDFALDTYGPRGAFWTANPTLPHKPVTQIEVCNEPNFGYGFSGAPAEIARLYAQVLIAAYDRINATWPDVLVVGFATGGASYAAPDFVAAALSALQAAGRLDCFDVMSLHQYSSNRPPEEAITESWGSWLASQSMDDVQKLMLDFTIDKPLWITEVGYQISHADGGTFTDPARTSFGAPETVTPMQQAAYTVRMNMAAARHDIRRVYHMSAIDTDNYNGGWFGPAPDNAPRPVATAMRQLIQLLNGATHLEVILDGGSTPAEDPFAYRISTPRGSVMVAWCQVPAKVKLPIDPDTETVVTDLLGNTITTITDSSYQASLSETPIFLHSPSTAK